MDNADNIWLKILLVDDDEDDYIIIRDLLSEIGEFELEFELAWAGDYDIALETIKREEHDICLLDYRLGERSGLELLREASERGYKVPIILLTGQGDREVDLEAMQSGAAGYLDKGQLDPPLLERSIRYAFAQRLKTLAESEQRFRSLVQNGSDLIAVVDVEGTVSYLSPSIKRLLGYRPHDLIGRTLFEYLHPEDLERVQNVFGEIIARPGVSEPVEVRGRHADGSWRDIEATANNRLKDPVVRGIVINARDIVERKALEDKLAYQATHDPLTDLPNRLLFMDRLRGAIDRAHRQRENFALLFMDLDNFKVINDSLGHQAGDELLVAVAERFRERLRAAYAVARLGGDEFTVLIEGIADIGDATRTAELIRKCLDPPFRIRRGDFFITCSIGIVLGTPAYSSSEDLLRNADIAMYKAKNSGKGRYEVFDPSMSATAMERLKLERDLRLALDRGELRIYYQPMMLVRSGRIAAVEALVRWEHPERSLMSPTDFIPLAEETGLIVPLGRWVLREACRQMEECQECYPGDPALSVSVNLSSRQFQPPTLVEEISEALQETGLSAHSLTLEITESAVQHDTESAIDTLRKLKGLGVKLAIDDFGTGYSSLSYLKRFPVDALKIDKSFVSGLGEGIEDLAIVRAIVDLAHTLGMHAIAEGVETAEQLAQLQEMGCDLAQGYYFARPLSGKEMSTFLSTNFQ